MSAQQELNLARAKRDRSIQIALDHADAVHGDWSDRAFAALHRFIRRNPGEFICLDFREWAERNGTPAPPARRAWGGVMQRAAREGLIVKRGFSTAKNPEAHMRPVQVWRPA